MEIEGDDGHDALVDFDALYERLQWNQFASLLLSHHSSSSSSGGGGGRISDGNQGSYVSTTTVATDSSEINALIFPADEIVVAMVTQDAPPQALLATEVAPSVGCMSTAVAVSVVTNDARPLADHHRSRADELRAKFEGTEKAFRDEFLSGDRRRLPRKESLKKKTSGGLGCIAAGLGDKVDQNVSSGGGGQSGGTSSEAPSLEQLTCLLQVLEQLLALRQLSFCLQRKCAFLEDMQTLLRSQNSMLLDTVKNANKTPVGKRRRQPASAGAVQRSATGRKASAAAAAASAHQVLEYQGSGGADDSIHPTCSLYQRSLSAGSLNSDLVDLDLDITDRLADAAKSGRQQQRQQDRSGRGKSLRLHEKWEQVKKVFSGKLAESGPVRSGSKTAGGGGGGTATPTDKQTKLSSSTSKKTTRSASTACAVSPAAQQFLLSPQLEPKSGGSGGSTRSVSPRSFRGPDNEDDATRLLSPLTATPSPRFSGSGEDSGTGSNLVAAAAAQRGRRDRSGDGSMRRKSSPMLKGQRQLLTVVSPDSAGTAAGGLGRSSSFKLPKTSHSLSPDTVTTSKSLPSTPVERISDASLHSNNNDVQSAASTKASGFLQATSAQKAKAAWDKVKDIVHTSTGHRDSDGSGNRPTSATMARRSSSLERLAVLPLPPPNPCPSAGPVRDVTASGGASRSIDDPWVERRRSRVVQSSEVAAAAAAATSTAAASPPPSAAAGQPDPAPDRGHGQGQGQGRGRGQGRCSVSPPSSTRRSRQQKRFSISHTSTAAVLSNSPLDLAGILAAGVSDDFTKKMQQWENRKKKGISKMESFDSAAQTKFTEDFIRKMEEWEMKKFSAASSPLPRMMSMSEDSGAAPVSGPSTGTMTLSPTVAADAETPQILSEAFSRTVQDWERIRQSRGKFRSGSEAAADLRPVTGGSGGKLDRSKSRERDKSRHRAEKELTKLTKKEQKLEDELKRLTQTKMKLETQLDTSSASEKDFRSPPAVETAGKRSADDELFSALDLLESIRGQPSHGFAEAAVSGGEVSEAPGHHSRSKSSKSQRRNTTTVAVQRMTSFAGPFSVSASGGTSTGSSNGEAQAPMRINDIMEETNRRLRSQLMEKEDFVGRLQDQVLQLTDRINAMEHQHAIEIERYKKELLVCSQWTKQSKESAAILSSIQHLRSHLENLRQETDNVHTELNSRLCKLCDLVEVEGNVLEKFEQRCRDDIQFCANGSAAYDILSAFEQHRSNIRSQFQFLKNFILERNNLLQLLQRHLLVQEVTNKLLAAELGRVDLDLRTVRAAQSCNTIRRWKTYNGHEDKTFGMHIVPESVDRQWRCQCSSVLLDAMQRSLQCDFHNEQLPQQTGENLLAALQNSVRQVTSAGTQVEEDGSAAPRSSVDAEAQTVMTLSDCDHLTSRSQSGTTQRPQQQQQLVQLLLMRQQQLAAAPCQQQQQQQAVDQSHLLATPVHAFADGKKVRKGSAPEFPTDFGRTQIAAMVNLQQQQQQQQQQQSAFRPVTPCMDWSPVGLQARRHHEPPRLPYFEVRDITADIAGAKRYFRPIATDDGINLNQAETVQQQATDRKQEKLTTETNETLAHVENLEMLVSNDYEAAVTPKVPSIDLPDEDGTTPKPTETQAQSTATEDHARHSSNASKPHRFAHAAGTSDSFVTKARRAHRSKTAELRFHRRPADGSTRSSPGARQLHHDPDGTGECGDDEDAIFSSDISIVRSDSPRSRTRSDSSVALSQSSTSTSNHKIGSARLAVADNFLQDVTGRRRSAGWTLDSSKSDRADHPESGGRASGAVSLRASPFHQSPSPLIVRKLKSAAELLRECNEHRRRSRPSSSQSASGRPQTSYCITGTYVAPSEASSSEAGKAAVSGGGKADAKVDLTNIGLKLQVVGRPEVRNASPEGGAASSDASTSESSSSPRSKSFSAGVATQKSKTPSSSPRSLDASGITLRPAGSSTATVATRDASSISTTSRPRSAIEPAATGGVAASSGIGVIPEPTKPTRTKFLDGNWFHKPKFFKSSK